MPVIDLRRRAIIRHISGEWQQFHSKHILKRIPNLGKWIAQARPIYCHFPATPELPESVNLLNAAFALDVFQSFLHAEIPAPIARNLLYTFHFREEGGETLALIAYSSEVISKNSSDSNQQETPGG